MSFNYLCQGGYIIVIVCLSVCMFVCQQLCAKTSERICMKFSGTVGSGPMNKWLNFGGEAIWIMDPDQDTGKTCLGGGIPNAKYCPSASSCLCIIMNNTRNKNYQSIYQSTTWYVRKNWLVAMHVHYKCQCLLVTCLVTAWQIPGWISPQSVVFVTTADTIHSFWYELLGIHLRSTWPSTLHSTVKWVSAFGAG